MIERYFIETPGHRNLCRHDRPRGSHGFFEPVDQRKKGAGNRNP